MLSALHKEIIRLVPAKKEPSMSALLQGQGFREHLNEPNVIARAHALANALVHHEKHIYQNDLIAGSRRGQVALTQAEEARLERELDQARHLLGIYGKRDFGTNADHFAPDYPSLVEKGIDGLAEDIKKAKDSCEKQEQQDFLTAAAITLDGLSKMIEGYGAAAEKAGKKELAALCQAVAHRPPEHFDEALQLVFFYHLACLYDDRSAMAFGRMDQYLFPFYQKDKTRGVLTDERAKSLVAHTLMKLSEARWFGGDDVNNIAIGGVTRKGEDAVNGLSYLILRAVGECGIPGPNLSARIHPLTPDAFLDECLQVIGTGLGYPALMNDEVNIAALERYGYPLEECRDYCMVGCIENFFPGKQPPWSDGRFNVPKYLELALFGGADPATGKLCGVDGPTDFHDMPSFLDAFKRQLRYGAAEYMRRVFNRAAGLNPVMYASPLLSLLCGDCVKRGLDLNNGGALLKTTYGACLMGIGTVADSLCALEQTAFSENPVPFNEILEALKADFAGYETLRRRLDACPKYGNADERVDQYAAWFLETLDEIFAPYRMPDGGPVFLAMAANVQNISAGKAVGATPDGRGAGMPLSDAASPTYGKDTQGPTAVVFSTTVCDYKKAACGTVLNQKFGPEMFKDPGKRGRLLALIRVYFARGGQEMQINAVSRKMLLDARAHPEQYKNLVVRVSGFSAYYTSLDAEVQKDILMRTAHEE